MSKTYGNAKVDEALDHLQALSMTEADFLDLALACLDQGGLSVRGQDVVRQAIGIDPVRDETFVNEGPDLGALPRRSDPNKGWS